MSFASRRSRAIGAEFLCALSANKHQIEFLEFTISDYATKNIIFMVRHRRALWKKRR